MQYIAPRYFNNILDGRVTISEMISSIKQFIDEEPQAMYTLVVGSDSHEKTSQHESKGKTINLVTAVVVYRKGYGGRYFWNHNDVPDIRSLRDKIYTETLYSLKFAQEFFPMIQDELSKSKTNYNLEIHVDIGNVGDTRDMIKEIVGMVAGHGFVAKTKPYSFGASYVADKYT